MIFLLQFLILCQVAFERFTEELDWEAPCLVNQYSQRGLYNLEEILGWFLIYLGIAANNYDELMFF